MDVELVAAMVGTAAGESSQALLTGQTALCHQATQGQHLVCLIAVFAKTMAAG
jgi:hypothetical protein